VCKKGKETLRRTGDKRQILITSRQLICMYINMHGEMIGLLDAACCLGAGREGGELKNRLGEPWNVIISIVFFFLKTCCLTEVEIK
jgi:hypothetical protein